VFDAVKSEMDGLFSIQEKNTFHYQPTLEKKTIFFNYQSNPRRKKRHKFLQLPGENEWQKKRGLENQ
jgi:hypothetical protein